MFLEYACQNLGWPSHDEVLRPKAAGPKHYAERVTLKIGQALKRSMSGVEVTTGILCADANSDTSEAPIAVVCQFSKVVSDEILMEAQRLCWNFSRTALLITLEPHRLQSWTCSKAPSKKRKVNDFRVLPPIEWKEGESPSSTLQQEAAQALHWVQLVSGGLVDKHKSKFPKDERVDAVLVSNLKAVRSELTAKMGLPIDVCHSLLARLIFTQFLLQRTDSAGRPAISQTVLDGRFDAQLFEVYQHSTALESILRDKEETYALFRWLNEKFNGDMFPGKGGTAEEREAEWQTEKDSVKPDHLKLLADFVSGRIHIKSKQQFLWSEYSFDTLPLEFISSVYEEFLTADDLALGAHYTPPHLVDFVLDGVLPWGGTDWDLKILDPCCGSSIFLVKAFQRLVQRWKNANPNKEPRIDDLRPILENNLLGVDMSKEALRVASFSLCLALCDALDPKHYWKRTVFPPLRNIRLIESDFFAENKEGFRTMEDVGLWDLVIGNAPWGAGSLESDSAGVHWGKINGWPVTNRNPGLIFLAKAAALTSKMGRVSMIVPAASLLYQSSSEGSNDFRRKLFTSFTVEEVVTLASLRWQMFKGVKSPACIVTLQPVAPRTLDVELNYLTPKPQYSPEDESTVIIEPQDMHTVTHDEAAHDPLIWSILLMGGSRDLKLIRQLQKEKSLSKLRAESEKQAASGRILFIRRGIQRGKKDAKNRSEILGRRLLHLPDFPLGSHNRIDADRLPLNIDPMVTNTADFRAFQWPQLIIKQSIIESAGRFQSRIVNSSCKEGVLCSQSYVSVHQFAAGDAWLRAAHLSFQSRTSAYYLALTSRLASDRASARVHDLLNVPIPQPTDKLGNDVSDLNEVDLIVEEAFHLKPSESALIEDMLSFVYREGGDSREGRKPTLRPQNDDVGDLYRYADFFVKTLHSTFGKNKAVRATIFEEQRPPDRLPIRMVAIHLDWSSQQQVITKDVLNSKGMRQRLKEAFSNLMGVRSRQGVPVTSGIGFQRIARVFVTHESAAGEKVPSVLYLKPDQRRHWTRSQALRDADELVVSIMKAKKCDKA